jgi:hypothetical protein
MSLQGSGDAYKLLYPMVVDAAQAGQLEIEVVDSDR